MKANKDRSSSSMGSTRVLLLENISQVSVNEFIKMGFEVEQRDKLTIDELKVLIPHFNIIGVRSKTKLTKAILHEAKNLECVGCFCIGTDQTDLVYAAECGIPVFNAPFANTRSVAEIVIACLISLARSIGDHNMQMHRGEWKKTAIGRYEVRGKTLGIIGYGHVGSQLSVLAEAMGMRVIYYDILLVMPLGNAEMIETQRELLVQADFVSLHIPFNKTTQNLITAKEIAQMKRGSFFVNYSRGKVVDTSAVADALKCGHLAGAAFDVFPVEPSSGEAFTNPLQRCPNTLLTPHIGGSTEEAQAGIGHEVAHKVIKYVTQGSTTDAKNFPNVSLPDVKKKHKILNIHRNVPGVLRVI